MNIFLMTAIIAQGSDDLSQLSIVGGDSTSVTQGTKVLARIETMTSGITKRTRLLVSKSTAVGLCIILNKFQTMATADVSDTFRKGTKTIEMHDHHGSGSRGDSLFDE